MNNPKLQKIEQLINKENFDAIALIPSPSFIWLTGKDKHLETDTLTLYSTSPSPSSLQVLNSVPWSNSRSIYTASLTIILQLGKHFAKPVKRWA